MSNTNFWLKNTLCKLSPEGHGLHTEAINSPFSQTSKSDDILTKNLEKSSATFRNCTQAEIWIHFNISSECNDRVTFPEEKGRNSLKTRRRRTRDLQDHFCFIPVLFFTFPSRHPTLLQVFQRVISYFNLKVYPSSQLELVQNWLRYDIVQGSGRAKSTTVNTSRCLNHMLVPHHGQLVD